MDPEEETTTMNAEAESQKRNPAEAPERRTAKGASGAAGREGTVDASLLERIKEAVVQERQNEKGIWVPMELEFPGRFPKGLWLKWRKVGDRWREVDSEGQVPGTETKAQEAEKAETVLAEEEEEEEEEEDNDDDDDEVFSEALSRLEEREEQAGSFIDEKFIEAFSQWKGAKKEFRNAQV